MKNMKIKNKILLANMFTVVCAVLTLLSFSAMQGFDLVTAVSICIGIYFAVATLSFAKLENALRKNMNRIKSVRTVRYEHDSVAKVA